MIKHHWTAAFALLATALSLQAQHIHVNAGALSTTIGSQLAFTDADNYAASSGYVINMVLRTNGPAAGLYDGGPTFAAAGSDGFEGTPAVPGSQLAMIVKAVSGPSDGSFSFWESPGCLEPDDENYAPHIAFTVTAGTTNGTNHFVVSENNGQPGQDPYGHCHGRLFTANKPGLYTVWFQIADLSRNGPDSVPLHTPSPIYSFYFNAGLNIARLHRTNETTSATFGTRFQSRFYLEASPALDEAALWTTVAGPVNGNNRLQTLTDPNAFGEPPRFYRLRISTP